MSEFLSSDYDVPSKEGNYMKFQDGENRFRCLTSPILGWLDWRTEANGSRKPLRTPMDKPFNIAEVEDPDKVKHFWALVVYNYNEEKVQILEITQKGIQKTLRALARDEDWGSPLNYDVVITREGKELNTKYQVQPKPVKKLDPKVVEMFIGMSIDLSALYRGEDPFSKKEEAVDPNDIPNS